jgi:hypothetical protein
MAGSSTALPFSVAAFCGAKRYNPCLRSVLLLYLGTVKTQRQFQMLSCKAAQGKDVMKLNSIRQATVRAAALGLCGIALASAPAARAEDKMTAQSLIDRQLILDQITRYYYNFGKVDRQSEESFYAEDGELILGTRHYKGKASSRHTTAPPRRLQLARPLRLERRQQAPRRPRARGPLLTWPSRIR